jgi:RNA polymerase sigma factor (sigma-70 family)
MIAATEYPRAYVRTMLTRAYLSWRRSWATRHVLLAFDGPGTQFDEPSTGDHAHAIAERDAIWRRLATLPRRQRSVLVLRYYERLADAEIAEVLGCSAVTVRGYASRALAVRPLPSPRSRSASAW